MQDKQNITYCSRCRIQFECKVDDIKNCQCQSVSISPQTTQFLLATEHQCLCADCLIAINTMIVSNPKREVPQTNHLIENIHYYKEGNYFVFTELYHYLKGICCGNYCRHCAYGKAGKVNQTINPK